MSGTTTYSKNSKETPHTPLWKENIKPTEQRLKEVRRILLKNAKEMDFNQPLPDVDTAIPTKKVKISTKDRILNSIPTWSLHQQLSKEIKVLVDENCVNESEASDLISKIIDDLKRVLKHEFSCFDFEPYGSYVNGLACRNSDLDLSFIDSLDRSETGASPFQSKLSYIERVLRTSREFKAVAFLYKAKIPLVKLIHNETGKNCDISFQNYKAMRNTSLIKTLIKINPNIKILTLCLKYLLLKYDIYGTNKVTTYVIFWLVVYFLQVKTGFYSIRELFIAKIIKFDDNSCHPTYSHLQTNQNYTQPDFETNTYFVFQEFLHFYANYEFAKFVICPYSGEEIDVKEFNNLQTSPWSNLEVTSFPYHCINIQDPIEHNTNLSRSVGISDVYRFKRFCYHLHRFSPSPNKPLKQNEQCKLSNIFLIKLPTINSQSMKLNQYTKLPIIKNEKHSPLHFPPAVTGIRKMMELMFEFEPKNILFEEDRWKNSELAIAYFSYIASARTWRNENILNIFSNCIDDIRHIGYDFEVFIVCQKVPETELIKISFQSEDPFSNFLLHKPNTILRSVLERLNE